MKRRKTIRYYKVKRCLRCLRRPVCFSGHYHQGNKDVIAGFCKKHEKDRGPLANGLCMGCYGIKPENARDVQLWRMGP